MLKFPERVWGSMEDAVAIIKQCLTVDTTARLTAEDASRHPYFTVSNGKI